MTTTGVPTDLAVRLELAGQSPDRVGAGARAAAGRQAAVLAAVAATVWLFDVVQVVAH